MTDDTTKEAKSADWNGNTYDAISDPQAAWGAVVVSRLELTGNECVLDAGCGSGRVTEFLLDALPTGHVIALDRSASMLSAARERLAKYGDRVSFVESDLLALSPEVIGRDGVDAIFSNATFHWVTDHDHLFRNLADVLVPGGQLVAQCGGKGNIAGLMRIVASLGKEREGTWEYASAEVTEERLENVGFTEISTWLSEAPTSFESQATLRLFLESVCLRDHIAQMDDDERQTFIAKVADLVPNREIDYVRLNITARRAQDGPQ